MARRSPVRFLAPFAVVAVAVALYAVLSHGLSDSGSETAPPGKASGTATTSSDDGTSSTSKKRRRKTYVIKPGDTPSSIADKTGVPLADIERLNPDLDPQALSPGTRIRLRP